MWRLFGFAGDLYIENNGYGLSTPVNERIKLKPRRKSERIWNGWRAD
jgi:hypothetical protein